MQRSLLSFVLVALVFAAAVDAHEGELAAQRSAIEPGPQVKRSAAASSPISTT